MTEPHLIAVLALDCVTSLDFGIPAQVFGAARTATGERLYRVSTCSPDRRPVRGNGGFQILPDHGLELLERADSVLVSGIYDGAPLTDGTVAEPVRLALVRAYERGARIMSICTGAMVLAAAGLLDGRPATTHWRHTQDFRDLYPRVRLDPDVLFVDDGNVLTSAGVAAGIDLCLHVIRLDHGSEIANRVARRCVVPPWRDGGQAQYIERPVPRPASTGTAQTREWVRQHLDAPPSLRQMAEHARMSVRTFTRRFREETGVSPARWLLQQRTDHARVLLETTDLSVDQVARLAGFGTAAALRQQMNQSIGVAPTAYRRTFRPPHLSVAHVDGAVPASARART